MDRLIRGYKDFRKRRWPRERARFLELSKRGQHPEYLIIACSDSRSDPATILDAHPGEFFVVRLIAAIVPPYDDDHAKAVRAAIAFGVLSLKVRNIVVMGHAQCGGVAAAVNPKAIEDVPFVQEWVSLLEPAIAAHAHAHGHGGIDPMADIERETVRLSVRRLLEYPFVAERVRAGKLVVDGARFRIADGLLELLNAKTGAFEPVGRRSWLSWLG